MKRRGVLFGGLAAPLFITAARAGERAALSGDRFMQDGAEYLIADIIAPPLYTFENETPAYFDEAKAALGAHLAGAAPALEEVAPPTRWGVRIVRASVGEEPLDLALVREGAARVRPRTDDLERIDRLLDAERAARLERRGLWSHEAYKVFSAGSAGPAVGDYNLIEGTVRRAAKAGSRIYLNFGDDYRKDFTAGTGSRLARKWAKAGFDLTALNGAQLRIRGFVEAINGPSIDVTHQRQIEILAPPAG